MPNKTFRIAVCLFIMLLFCSVGLLGANATPCADDANSRQLDFWVGSWKVTAPGSAPNAASQVSLAQDKCVVIENWDGGRGHTGANFFAYSADDKKWHGMFTDNRGRVHMMEGTGATGEVQFTASGLSEKGTPELNRVRIVSAGAGKVQQIWEKSNDNGATWKQEFQGMYEHSKP